MFNIIKWRIDNKQKMKKYEEKYMICYCLNHHVMFHFYRGDGYDKLLASQKLGGIGLSL